LVSTFDSRTKNYISLFSQNVVLGTQKSINSTLVGQQVIENKERHLFCLVETWEKSSLFGGNQGVFGGPKPVRSGTTGAAKCRKYIELFAFVALM